MTSQRRYIGTTGVAQRYGRAPRTIARWLKEPPVGFPRPFKLNGRWLWDLNELESHDQSTRQPASKAA